MSNVVEKVRETIQEAESEDLPCDDWVVYVSPEDFYEIYRDLDSISDDPKLYEHRIVEDTLVEEPIILPEEPQGFNNYANAIVKNAPLSLIKKVLDIEERERQDVFRDMGVIQYIARHWFDVEDKHLRLNRAKIDKLNLDLRQDEVSEYDQEPDYLSRVKFGKEYSGMDIEVGMNERVDEEIARAVDRTIESVERIGVYGTRERTIKYPYPCMDHTHRERYRCGTKYTHYGGVLLMPVDVETSKLEFRDNERNS